MASESTNGDRLALEAAVNAAEQKRSQGDLWGTYLDYQAIAAQRLGGNYDAADLTIWQSLADLAAIWGDFDAADYVLLALVNLCQEAGNLYRADFARLKRIHLALNRGQLRQAQLLFEEMTPSIGSIESIEIARHGLLAWEAECYWPNAEKSDRTILFTLLYLEMGRLCSALGQYNSALELLNRGLDLATAGELQTTVVLARQQNPWFQLMIAQVHLESGLLSEAAAVLEIEILKRFLGSPKELSLQIQWRTLAGKLALLQGKFGKAQEQFQTILNLCHELKVPRGVIIASLNLARVLIVLNQNQRAAEYLSGIASDVEQLEDPHLKSRMTLLQQLTQARSQSLVAGSFLSVSDLRQADTEPESQQTKEYKEYDNFTFGRTQSPNYLTFFEDRVLEFQWHLSQSNIKGATQMLAHIEKVFARTDSRLIRTEIQILQGILSYYRGLHQVEGGQVESGQESIKRATVILDRTRQSLANMGLKPDRWQVQRVLGWCLMRLQSPSTDLEKLAEETNQLLKEMTDSLPAEQQATFLLNKWTADEEYIAMQIARLEGLQKRLRKSPLYQRSKVWLQILRLLNEFMIYLDSYRDMLAKRTIQDTQTLIGAEAPLALWQRLLQHPWRQATLSFLVLPDRVFVVRNWFLWLDFSVIRLTRLELRNLVEQWYEPLEAKSKKRGISLQAEPEEEVAVPRTSVQSDAIARKLAEKLHFSTLLNLPKYIDRLTVVPDDVLHIFPFAAVKHKNRYLVESYSLNVAYNTARVVGWSFDTPRSKIAQTPPRPASTQFSVRTTNKVLLVGVSHGSTQFAALPGVKQEIESICQWLSEQRITPQILLDEDVDKESLLRDLESTNLLHIACHGVFQHNQADRSGLVLNPQSTPPQILSLREIAELNLTRLHHVTLSTCSSADHLVLPGRWVISLPEALWRSGAGSILGCLWEVYDQLAITFMQKFYSYLKTMPRDKALQRTQLDCLEQRIAIGNGLDSRDPKYWAGFNLYGDCGNFYVDRAIL